MPQSTTLVACSGCAGCATAAAGCASKDVRPTSRAEMAARHAAADGSFGRSAGGAALRGAGLLAIAVILGIVLLRNGGGDPYSRALRTVASPSPEITVRPPTATTVTGPVRSPSAVKALPLNGTTINGAGLATFNRLKQAGYNVLAASNTT